MAAGAMCIDPEQHSAATTVPAATRPSRSSGRSATVSTGPPRTWPNQSGVVSPPWQLTKCVRAPSWLFVQLAPAGGDRCTVGAGPGRRSTLMVVDPFQAAAVSARTLWYAVALRWVYDVAVARAASSIDGSLA